MDDLDGRQIAHEAARLARILTRLAGDLTLLPSNRAAELLAALTKPIEDLDAHARRIGVPGLSQA